MTYMKLCMILLQSKKNPIIAVFAYFPYFFTAINAAPTFDVHYIWMITSEACKRPMNMFYPSTESWGGKESLKLMKNINLSSAVH